MDVNAGESLCQALGDRAFFSAGDVGSENSMQAAFSELESFMPPVNGCVTSAGVMPTRDPIEKMPVEDFRRVMDNHISGTFITCKIAGTSMMKSGGGSMVTLSSVLALRPGPVPGSGAGKAAIINRTPSVAVQGGKKNIRVNAI